MLSGRIKSVDSIFFYAPGESYATFAHTEFKPLFLDELWNKLTVEQQEEATRICGTNKECLFDFTVTGTLANNILVLYAYGCTTTTLANSLLKLI